MSLSIETEAGAPRTPWQARLPFYYGWVIVGTAFVTFFMAAAIAPWSVGIFVTPMQADLGWSRSAFFLPLTVRSLIAVAGTPLIGRYLDRRRGAIFLLAFHGLLVALSTVLIMGVQKEWQFLMLFGVLGGVATIGQPMIITAAIVPKWFIRQRARALTIATTGGGAAAFVLPLVLTGLIEAFGWRTAWVVLGAAVLVVTVPLAFLFHRQPEDLGMEPDGAPRQPAGPERRSGPAPEYSYTIREALCTKSFWLLVLGLALAGPSLAGLPTNMVPMFVDKGYSIQVAAGAFTAYGLASTSARTGWGYIASRTHPRVALMILSLYAVGVILVLPAALGNIVSLFAVAAMTGFGMGGVFVLNPMIWPSYFGRAHLGAINGIALPLTGVTSAIGPVMMSLIFDRTGSYQPGLWLLTVLWTLCAVAIYSAKPQPRPAQAAP